MVKTLFLNLPNNLGTFVFGFLIVSVLYTAVKLLTTVIQVYRFRQLQSQSKVVNYGLTDILRNLKITGRVVVLREDKPFAYCFGIRSPRIFISSGLVAMMSSKELEVILRHEKYHLGHRDNLIQLLATFAESLFPFFPIFTDLIQIYKTDRELLADQSAIHEETDNHSLSSVLKKLLQYESATIPAIAHAIADIDTIETRIRSLLNMKVNYRQLGKRNLFYSILSAGVLITLMGAPVNAVEFHQNGLDAMIVCNQNVSCESVCKDHIQINIQSTRPTYSSKNFSSSK